MRHFYGLKQKSFYHVVGTVWETHYKGYELVVCFLGTNKEIWTISVAKGMGQFYRGKASKILRIWWEKFVTNPLYTNKRPRYKEEI